MKCLSMNQGQFLVHTQNVSNMIKVIYIDVDDDVVLDENVGTACVCKVHSYGILLMTVHKNRIRIS